MELTQTIKCQTRVSASLDESGTLSIKVFGTAEYAPGTKETPGPTTTAEVFGNEIPEGVRDALRAAMQAALDGTEVQKLLGDRIGKAIHKSAEIAAAHGEI